MTLKCTDLVKKAYKAMKNMAKDNPLVNKVLNIN